MRVKVKAKHVEQTRRTKPGTRQVEVHEDMVFVSFEDGGSLYSTWISAEDAVGIGDVGRMALASKAAKKGNNAS